MTMRNWLERFLANKTSRGIRHRELRRPSVGMVSCLVEGLESRQLLTANLQILNAVLVSGTGQPIVSSGDKPVIGERMRFQVSWQASGLVTGNSYTYSIIVDGKSYTDGFVYQGNGTGGNGTWTRDLLTSVATPGAHSIQAVVDNGSTLAETNESDNSITFSFTPGGPTNLPSKFQFPILGDQGKDWFINNHVDVNPDPGIAHDFTGGTMVYDGHDAWDIGVPAGFRSMDSGVGVYAVAGGVVKDVVDGNVDRHDSSLNNSGGEPANYVLVDHGNGWQTSYVHLARNSISVQIGETVQAGEMLGVIGSSGISTGVHLHFSVYHNWVPVETMYSNQNFFVKPFPYELDVPVVVQASGIVSSEYADATGFTNFISEFPHTSNILPLDFHGLITAWNQDNHTEVGKNFKFNWYYPNGSLATSIDFTSGGTGGNPFWFANLAWTWSPGTWQVGYEFDGVEVKRDSFIFGTGVPNLAISQGKVFISDQRTTPINFGTAASGGSAAQQTFTIWNYGYAPLSLGTPVLEGGFSLASPLPSVLQPGTSTTFTILMPTSRVGAKFGSFRLASNDPLTPDYRFNLEGTVTGTVPAGSPDLTLPGPGSRVYQVGGAPIVVNSQSTVTDSNSSNFANGKLIVRFAGNGLNGDQLQVLSGGTGGGQISVLGQTIFCGGVSIGTFSGGANGGNLTIQLNSSASLAAVQSLLRSITYTSTLANPAGNPRYIQFELTDNTGLVSDVPYQVIIVDKNPNSQSPSAVGVFHGKQFQLDQNNNGFWNGTPNDANFSFGNATDVPISGDWNGDGWTEVGVFRNGTFYLDLNANRKWDASDAAFKFGNPTDVPISGDWNGDGKTDVGTFRSGTFYLDLNGSRKWEATDIFFKFGNPTDVPITGDWNGDGKWDVGTDRSGTFYLDLNGSRKWEVTDIYFKFGNPTDAPITGDWNGDGKWDVGVVRNGTFYLDQNGNRKWDTGIDLFYQFGSTSDKPIVGSWSVNTASGAPPSGADSMTVKQVRPTVPSKLIKASNHLLHKLKRVGVKGKSAGN